MEEAKTIKIGTRDVLIDIPWVHDEFDNTLRMSMGVRRKAQSSNLRYGAKESDFKNGARYSRYFLSADEQAFKNKTVIGSMFVSSHVSKMTPDDSSTIFVYNISENNENDFTSQSHFWVTAVDERGHMLSGDDTIALNDDDLVTFISNYRSISQKVEIVYCHQDQTVSSIVEAIADNDEIITLQGLDEARLIAYIEESEQVLIQIYRSNPVAVKKVLTGVSAVILIGSGVFGYQYYTSSPSVDYFTSDNRIALIGDIRSSADNALKSYESSKVWNDTTYSEDVVKEFNDFYLDNKMTSIDVGNIMFAVERTMPLYAVDWQMESITMEEGEFYITYKRRPDGRGTFIILDEYLAALNKEIAEYDLAPISENRDFNTRAYKVTPRIKVGLTGKAEVFATQRRTINAFNAQREKLLDEIKDTADDWIKANARFESMSLMDRLFFENTIGMMRESQRHEDKVKELQGQLEQLEGQGIKSLSESIDPSWVSGNWNDYIVLMQTDNLFTWSIPSFSKAFPDEDTIASKGGKANKRKKENDVKYETAIQAYSVRIAANEGQEDNTVRTYGILDFQQLMRIVNQPSIQVVGVNYLKESEQWHVDIRFYTKTSIFDQFLM